MSVVGFGLIEDWEPAPGRLIGWAAAPESVAAAARAPLHPVPPSHQQEQYLRLARRHSGAEFRYSGLCLVTAEVPAGDLDREAMTRAVNAFLRRHDTFRTWFDVGPGGVVRRHLVPPEDVRFVPVDHGEIDDAETLREHVQKTTPGPFDWDCFTFGAIERPDSTTVYLAADHLHTDGFGQYLAGFELALLYLHEVWPEVDRVWPEAALPPRPASYLDYCAAERAYTAALTPSSPGVRRWLHLLRGNDGRMPSFPLDLGRHTDGYTRSAHRTIDLLGEPAAARFDRSCRALGAEFTGGIFAAAALAERELTGADYYFGLTPISTRVSAAERASVGWYVSLVPVAFPIAATADFARMVPLAQRSFDDGLLLAPTSVHRVLELAADDAEIRVRPGWSAPMISYVDARELTGSEMFDLAECGVYANRAASEEVLMWINRLPSGTTLSVIYPDTPVAHESVDRYLGALRAVFESVAANG